MTRQPDFPLHRLNTPLTKLWLISPHGRAAMARALARRYQSGVGVCAATLRLIAVVTPTGAVRELAPPHQLFEMWQIANQPKPVECPCANFFDPEVKGAYRHRSNGEHHPFCQFDRSAMSVFNAAKAAASYRLDLPTEGGVIMVDGERKRSTVKAQARPDEWERLRDEQR
jgi:hypothetical protein